MRHDGVNQGSQTGEEAMIASTNRSHNMKRRTFTTTLMCLVCSVLLTASAYAASCKNVDIKVTNGKPVKIKAMKIDYMTRLLQGCKTSQISGFLSGRG
jgi:hypothetical protein